MMSYTIDWLSLFFRWFHVIAGIAWIGASFYFVWLDNSLEEPPAWKKAKGIKGDLWAVHGGGFYEVAKYQLGPEQMPTRLHWFKWEAYTTWLTGTTLLFLVYYLGPPGLLLPAGSVLTQPEAIVLGLGSIAAMFVVYELMIRSPLRRHGLVFGILIYAVLVFAAWGLDQVFTGRAAYIHVGAMIGTIMVANVLVGIMPSQRALVDTVARGEVPGERIAHLAAMAKLRSTHNNYFTLPLIFIMISNHYPMTYGHAHSWLVLAAIGFIAALARHFFNLRHRGKIRPMILVSAATLFCVLAILIKPVMETANGNMPKVSEARIQKILSTRCSACHSAHPTEPGFSAPPAGIELETPQMAKAYAQRIYQAAVATHYMPLGNLTKITPQERADLGRWARQQ